MTADNAELRIASLRAMDTTTLRSVRESRHGSLLSVTRARFQGAWARRWLRFSPSTRRRLLACGFIVAIALPSIEMRFVVLHASVLSVAGNLLWWLLDTRQELRLAEGRHSLERPAR